MTAGTPMIDLSALPEERIFGEWAELYSQGRPETAGGLVLLAPMFIGSLSETPTGEVLAWHDGRREELIGALKRFGSEETTD